MYVCVCVCVCVAGWMCLVCVALAPVQMAVDMMAHIQVAASGEEVEVEVVAGALKKQR